MNYDDYDPVKAPHLDLIGDQFGIKIIPREKGQSDLIELYSEDDESWYLQQTFAAYWLKDLAKIVDRAQKIADCEIIMK